MITDEGFLKTKGIVQFQVLRKVTTQGKYFKKPK